MHCPTSCGRCSAAPSPCTSNKRSVVSELTGPDVRLTPGERPMSLDNKLSRRDLLRLTSAGALGLPLSGWFRSLVAGAAKHPQRKKSCILLWMAGGPSHLDTFD